MNARALFAEIGYPARSAACLLAIITFVLLLVVAANVASAVAGIGSVFALLLLAVTVPALTRYLVTVAEARAAGREVEPPGVEYFTPAGSGGGTLVPLFIVLALVALPLPVIADRAPAWTLLLSIAGILCLPAMLGVFVVTRSSLEAINPLAAFELVRQAGAAYFAAPVFAALAAGVVTALSAIRWWLGLAAGVYLLFSLHALVGALVREAGLLDAIDIPEDTLVRDRMAQGALERERRLCLNHAYGLFSRGNRDGGLGYLARWLDQDPDPAAARAWFMEQMLGWEDRWPAFWYGQDYLGRLLAEGERVGAVKLLLRLRLADDRFRPAAPDLPAAIEAARASGNRDLAEALERAVS